MYKKPMESRYPKPKQMGGTLIRRSVGLLRKAGLKLPIDSHILIAVSGGQDSLALAELLVRYGRRIVPREKIEILTIDHRWPDSNSEQAIHLVSKWCKAHALKHHIAKAEPPRTTEREGLEAHARSQRKRIYSSFALRGFKVFTAHQADDLAETLLWRLFTGASKTHGGGLWVQSELEVRPLLSSRRKELKAFLDEEELQHWEDPANTSERFLRTRVRNRIVPAIEREFPRAVEHLVEAALDAQCHSDPRQLDPNNDLASHFFRAGVYPRRAHWKAIESLAQSPSGETHLPGGWRLSKIENPANGAQIDPTQDQGKNRG